MRLPWVAIAYDNCFKKCRHCNKSIFRGHSNKDNSMKSQYYSEGPYRRYPIVGRTIIMLKDNIWNFTVELCLIINADVSKFIIPL